MNTAIKDFCKAYKEIPKQRENLKRAIEGYYILDDFEKTMYVTIYANSTFPNNGNRTIKLDDEDLEYLYKKYSPLLVSEMEKEISSIKQSYIELLP